MHPRTFRIPIFLMLLCVFTEIQSFKSLIQWLKSRNKKDYSEIVDFLSTSYPLSQSDENGVCLNNKWRDQILDFLAGDEKTESFLRCQSPSVNKQIMNLLQKSGSASELIEERMPEEATGTVIPMSTSVILQTMALTPAQIMETEQRTKLNSEELYVEMRLRLTADLFGSICLGDTSEAINAWITSPRPRINIWKNNRVIRSIQDEIKSQMTSTGLIVDKTRGYLAALPDGLIGNNAIVKVHVVQRPRRNLSRTKYIIADVLIERKFLFYEIQGLLAITDREECILVLISKDIIKKVVVKRNKDFWNTQMLEKIEKFCMDTLLPELSRNVLPNINDIRKAAAIIHIVTTDLPIGRISEIIAETQKGGFDTFMRESKIRLLPEHFQVILDETKTTKTKMEEILECYYKNREDWKFRRRLKMIFVQRLVASSKLSLDLEFGGLVIDNVRGYLATFPSVFGYSRERKDKPNRTVRRPNVIFEVVTPVIREHSKQAKLDGLNFMAVEEGENGKRYSLRKDSKYYYKVQGSMAISRARNCIFIVGFPGLDPVHVENIEFDGNLWEDMSDQLDHFYYSSFLMYHASPEAFDQLVPGPSLKDLNGWQTDPPTNPEVLKCTNI